MPSKALRNINEDFRGLRLNFRVASFVDATKMELIMEFPGRSAARESASRDDRRAKFASVARENEAALLRTARRLTSGDEDRAQDMVQEAFVRGYDAYLKGQFVDGTNWRAWLTRIMT